MKLYKISEIIYIIIAIISTYKAIFLWDIRREKAYLFIGFIILSIFMVLFRRYYRKKFNSRNSK